MTATPDEAFDLAADEVYAVRPRDFVACRTGHVRAARSAGNKELASRIGALRRPSTAAWLVNLLVREQREQIAALLELGAAMRRAQAKLSADELRALTVQRQQVVRALASQAHALASEQGEDVSRDALHQVADTLQAALADAELAEQVRAGRLTTPLSYSGFGPAGLSVVRSAPESDEGGDDDDDGDDDDGDEAARASEQAAELRRRLDEAKAAVQVAARALVRGERALVSAEESLTRADRELARTEQVVSEREEALAQAQQAADRARAKHGTVQHALDDARAARERLRGELAEAKQAEAALVSEAGPFSEVGSVSDAGSVSEAGSVGEIGDVAGEDDRDD